MGLGRFGGGLGVTRWLVRQGASVLLTDLDPVERLAEPLAELAPLISSGAVELRLGGHLLGDFMNAEVVVANAAVAKPWENEFLLAAGEAGATITTEIGLLLRHWPCPRSSVVGVTGSVGKSTTTAMIADALGAGLRSSRRVLLGGNIGGSLLGELDQWPTDAIVVLELSSAMLYWIKREFAGEGGWSPGVAVVTNIAANHLDWHGAYEHYVSSKQNILRHQRAGDTAVLGQNVLEWASLAAGRVVMPSEGELAAAGVEHMLLPGEHNRINAAMALAACRAIAPGLDPASAARAISKFGGLAHRLQLVSELAIGGGVVRCYNDSKATTPESTLRAVDAVASAPGASVGQVHLIAGGYDKKVDLSAISGLAGKVAGIYAIGATGPAIVAGCAPASSRGAMDCGTLSAAMQAVRERLKPGDILLLSPGCASWDQYVNFEARGDEFAKIVHAWSVESAP
jgi:UDP-N-acetylmuramoylalanine--D-glutamate ligase